MTRRSSFPTARPARRTPAPGRAPAGGVCIYAGDGGRDYKGNDRCVHCRLPKSHPRHRLPPTPDQAAVIDARRAGEHDQEAR